ncbi:EAL domain-containing protein [Kineococcus rhizosphaerae]|uniref:EAL domain-containing protein (Putative c-di-GMP-specific phosphodiesterase class I) n=1 Tax=Kineococcus rhizosphaerae TaxID=559628 RepID=A0A2T0R2F0_9ACTN|nr:EAL domain-containing protein [Kineococcus rhizosphaerae]PRY13982.1 EAL domain-containing protein (putative c-di-GMP-specific phosphodiesterase class I) [Kineococcus rhizosphaerae]
MQVHAQDDDADAVAQLLDLARDIFGTPVAALTRPTVTTPHHVEQTSSELDPHATVRLLAATDLALASPAVDVVRPDGAADGRIVGVGADPSERLEPRQLEALHVVAALIAGVLHHRDRRRADREDRLASLDALVAGSGRSTVLQPIVDLRSGAVVGAEALSRFTSPAGTARRPEQVFSDARTAGVGVELEQAAIASALDQLPLVPMGGYLSVNASADALLDPRTRDLLTADGSERLVVEITEHDPVADYEALTGVTSALRRHGVRIAVDDAGAGFASLQHVLHLTPDIVKLDIAFVRGIDTDPARRAVARALVGFASELGSTMVAEGVEREDELAVLTELGVECGQGYLLGRPTATPYWGAGPDGTTAIVLPR